MRKSLFSFRFMNAAAALAALTILVLPGAGCTAPSDVPRCGDGRVDDREMCDDGNLALGDGCTFACTIEPDWYCRAESPSVCARIECGDGVVSTGEECDAGESTSSCDADCTLATCGDGTLNTSSGEQCDDGNRMGGDGCSPSCEEEPDDCGDGTCDFEHGETCTNCAPDCMATPECNDCEDADEDRYFDAECGGNDCDDTDPSVHPDADEIACNMRDDDCNNATRDGVDADGDGSWCGLDCDDNDPARSPEHQEMCGNGIDDDCNDGTTDTRDADEDGYSCVEDCNDSDPMIHPGMTELCNNGRDDDCSRATRDVFDVDMDGEYCNVDCDDNEPAAYSGNTEICGDGIDNDCDPRTEDVVDRDGDGFDCRTDCDEVRPNVNPAQRELCGNGMDDDCDPATTDLWDIDEDGFDCRTDCWDGNREVFPGACGSRFYYSENFEEGPGGWTASGDVSSWAHGTPSSAKLHIIAAASGANAWVTNLTGPYAHRETSYLTSPAFDFSALVGDPELSFHHIFQTERADRGWLEMSLDAGATWTKVGEMGAGANWYNVGGAAHAWSGTSGRAGVWRRARIPLTGAAGNADIRIRFVFQSDVSVAMDGFGVDDIEIRARLNDLAMRSVTLVDVHECGSREATVRLSIVNLGTSTADAFEVAYTLDGGTEVVETITTPLSPGATYDHDFVGVDLSTPGVRTIRGRVGIAMDEDLANDRGQVVLDVLGIVPLGAGFFAGFEESADGFTVSGTTTSWARGVPSGTFIPAAATGTYAFVTNPAGLYSASERGYVSSPCFDFSEVTTDPTLAFHLIYRTESRFDYGWVEVQVGTTGAWTKLETAASGTNWYNDEAQHRWHGSSGGPGMWLDASHSLTGTAGQEQVRFRFYFQSDPTAQFEGIGLDDVRITVE